MFGLTDNRNITAPNTNIPPNVKESEFIMYLIVDMILGINIANTKPRSNTLIRDLNTFFTL